MVITILEARVAPEKAATLEEAYTQATSEQLDAGIAQTFLVRSSRDADLWRILTFWKSREALDRMRQSVETPRGVLIFRTAEAEPALAVFDVVAHAEAPGVA